METSVVTHQVIIRYIGAAPAWLGNSLYSGLALVKDSSNNLQQAQSHGGTSGATTPTWSMVLGGMTSDGDPSTGITLGRTSDRSEPHRRQRELPSLVSGPTVSSHQRPEP